MKLIITIDLDNDAFDDHSLTEVSRILKRLSGLSSFNDPDNVHVLEGILTDRNGNTVGKCEISE